MNTSAGQAIKYETLDINFKNTIKLLLPGGSSLHRIIYS